MNNYIQLLKVYNLVNEFLFEIYLYNIEDNLYYLRKHKYSQDIQFKIIFN